jgi:predicted enzyme related to lactoylglutathione lyase
MSNSDANEGPVGEFYQIVIDVDDIDRSAHFWSEVLGLKVSHRWEQFLGFERQKGGLKVVLQIVPEKKTSKNRMHLDVAVEDVDAASARVEALGGMKLQWPTPMEMSSVLFARQILLRFGNRSSRHWSQYRYIDTSAKLMIYALNFPQI